MLKPNFWDDKRSSEKVIREVNELKETVENVRNLKNTLFKPKK